MSRLYALAWTAVVAAAWRPWTILVWPIAMTGYKVGWKLADLHVSASAGCREPAA